MKKLIMTMAVSAAVATSFADGVLQTSYADSGKIHSEAMVEELQDRVSSGWSPLGIGFVSPLEWPNRYYTVSPFRFNLFVGRHLDVYGLDIGGLGCYVTREFCGLQVSPLFNCIGESRSAVQISCGLNRCAGTMYGLQVGLVNIAEKGSGVQIGLVNYGNVYRGLQIGAVNVIAASSCPVMPVVNFAF